MADQFPLKDKPFSTGDQLLQDDVAKYFLASIVNTAACCSGDQFRWNYYMLE